MDEAKPNPVAQLYQGRGLNRSQAAAALGLSYATLHALEAGRLRALSPTVQRKLTEVFGAEAQGLGVAYLDWCQGQQQAVLGLLEQEAKHHA